MSADIRIYYEGQDITARIHCTRIRLTDRYGSVPDEVELTAWDEEGTWLHWDPQPGARLRVLAAGFDSGEQTLDHPQYAGRTCVLRAVSAAPALRTEGWGAMNSVSLLEMARRCARETGLTLATYGIEGDPRYRRVVRGRQTPIAFLAARCELEGIAVKVDDRRLLLIDRAWAAGQPPAAQMAMDARGGRAEAGAFDATSRLTLLCGGMEASAERAGEAGRHAVRNDVAFHSLGEGRRFAENLLAALHRGTRRIRHTIPFAPGLAALGVVQVSGGAAVAGLWTVREVVHRPLEDKSDLELEWAQ